MKKVPVVPVMPVVFLLINYLCAGISADSLPHMFYIGNNLLFTSMLKKENCRTHFWSHTTFLEMTFRLIVFGFSNSHLANRYLIFFIEI